MRLLHSNDVKFFDFFDQEVPEYAIVSHRWGKDEVSYEDFHTKRPADLSRQFIRLGWEKIVKACEIAQKRGVEWVWIDTCCIDKKSSQELSEAINSMFNWYSRSKECYVFLPGVPKVVPLVKNRYKEPEGTHAAVAHGGTNHEFAYEPFHTVAWFATEWFKRAWTLQELLAPKNVLFFNNHFECIGTMNELSEMVAQATSIPIEYLAGGQRRKSIYKASVAERMKWASNRNAVREEDMAYSLLGLFDVNMPLLYGEGKKAFLRLQMEIIRASDDESIFAWTPQFPLDQTLFLAPRVDVFAMNTIYKRLFFARQHYEVTNKGIKLTLPISQQRLVESLSKTSSCRMLVPLNCATDDAADEELGVIPWESSISIQNVLCLRVLVYQDPAMVNSDASLARQLQYLLGRRFSLELIRFPPCHRLHIPKAVENFLKSSDCPGYLWSDLVASQDADDWVDIPVYFRYN